MTKGDLSVNEQEQQEMFEKAKAAYPEAYADPRRKGVFWQLQDSSGFTEDIKYHQKLILLRWHDDNDNVTGGEKIRTKLLCRDANGDFYSVNPIALPM